MEQSKHIRLSICIPAYNKPNHLRAVLESITENVGARRDELEVVVHDDASPNCDAAAVAREFCDRLRITAKRHDRNLGFDANTASVAAAARGEFIWLLSDNDTLLPGSIDWLFGLLDEQPAVDYIYADRIGEADELRIGNAPSVRVNSADEFIVQHDLPGFISSQIFRKKLWDTVEVQKYIGSLWVHVGVILEFLPRAVILRSGKPLIRACSENSWVRGGKNLLTFLNLRDILLTLGAYGYAPATVRHFDALGARDLCEIVAYAKLYGLTPDEALTARMRHSFSGHPFYRSLALTLLRIPNSILRFFAPTFWFMKKIYTTL